MQLTALPLQTVRLVVGGHPPIWVTLCRAPQAVWDTSLADKGPPRCGQMGLELSRLPKRAPMRMKMTMTRRTMERPWIGGFQDQASLGLFVLLLGALWASGTGGSCAGVPRAATVFSWPIPDPGIFSVPLILGAAPNSRRRGFTSRRISSPSISGNICIIVAALRRRRPTKPILKMIVVHGGRLTLPRPRKSGKLPFQG
jgi:hypothetical protein